MPTIDKIQVQGTTYDINLPATASPTISSLTITGNLTVSDTANLSVVRCDSIESDESLDLIGAPITLAGQTSAGEGDSIILAADNLDVQCNTFSINVSVSNSSKNVLYITNENTIDLDMDIIPSNDGTCKIGSNTKAFNSGYFGYLRASTNLITPTVICTDINADNETINLVGSNIKIYTQQTAGEHSLNLRGGKVFIGGDEIRLGTPTIVDSIGSSQDYMCNLPNKSGTIALTSDIKLWEVNFFMDGALSSWSNSGTTPVTIAFKIYTSSKPAFNQGNVTIQQIVQYLNDNGINSPGTATDCHGNNSPANTEFCRIYSNGTQAYVGARYDREILYGPWAYDTSYNVSYRQAVGD